MTSLTTESNAECKTQETENFTFGQYQLTDPEGKKKTGAANITVSISDDVYVPMYTENRIPKGIYDDFGGHNQPPRWPENNLTEMVCKDGLEMEVPVVYNDKRENITSLAVDTAVNWQRNKIKKIREDINKLADLDDEKSVKKMISLQKDISKMNDGSWTEIISEFFENTHKYKGREYIGCITREAANKGEDILECGKRCTKEEIKIEFPNPQLIGYCGRPKKGVISRVTAIFVTFLGDGKALEKELNSNQNSPKTMDFDKIGISTEYYETRKVTMVSAKTALQELKKYANKNQKRDLSRWGQKEMLDVCLYLLKENKIITQEQFDKIYN
jgi:hypothetical protein